MNQAANNLETLKTIKRRCKATHSCLNVVYHNMLHNSSTEKQEILREAITALEQMFSLYESLKLRMRREDIREQIDFVQKWEKYLFCIDAITAHRTKDKHLLDGIGLEESFAKETALKLLKDYKTLNIKQSFRIA